MKVRKAFRFRLDPKPSQRKKMAQFSGCRRWVWNEALTLQKVRLDAGLSVMSYAEMCKMLTYWRNHPDLEWLAKAPVGACQQTLRDLRRAFTEFFSDARPNVRFPSFKRKYRNDGFRYAKSFRLDQGNSRIRLPKIGWVRYRKSREVQGEPKNVTVTRDGDHWFISIQVELEVETPSHPSESAVGVDLGVTRLATLSDGTVYDGCDALRSKMSRAKRLQRQLSRKERYSENWKKQKRRIQRMRAKIARTRKDYLHKVTTEISQNHAVVVIEDLSVQEMSGSDAPALNRGILDQGWGELRRQLEYKLRWQGGTLIVVDPRNTSKRCSECGHTDGANRPSQAKFKCQECGHTDHADLNAAKNILAAGHAATAPGGQPNTAPKNGEPARTVA